MIYRNRSEAGKHLAVELAKYIDRNDVLILALPRGGVPVAFEVAKVLGAPLDVFLVRKLGVPGQEELAMGAIATGGIRVLNHEVIDYLGIQPEVVEAVASKEQKELERRERVFRGDRAEPVIRNRTVILVDDGLATGSSMRAAATALYEKKPARIVVAVPICAPKTCDQYRIGVDEIFCAETPDPFFGVGHWYRDFSQITDDEVRELLDAARHEHAMVAQHRAPVHAFQ